MTFGLGHLGTAHIAGRGSHLKAADPERYREVAQLTDAQEIGKEALRLFRKGYQDEKVKGDGGGVSKRLRKDISAGSCCPPPLYN